jgi:hypothetical protein
MAISSINNIKNAVGLGVRPNLFRVSFAGGLTASNTSDLAFLVKAAALPGSTVGLIEVPHVAGRRLIIAGDRTFADWTTTVINDSGFVVRRQLEEYQKRFVTTDYSTTTIGDRNSAGVLATVTVEQLDGTGAVLRSYKLQNCFVTDISTIDLSYDTTDAIEEFTVTWAFDFYTVA